MDDSLDWTKTPPEPTKREKFNRTKALSNQKKLAFIAKHPEGVTAKDFHEAGMNCVGLERLMKLGLIKGKQIREPERGNRAFHWVWSAVKAENIDPNK
jgi:hypothetical protein